jgi:ATP-dependent exoDNAse (exonuclease V) alpha subunit
MAIYHLSVKMISRGKGQNAVAAAAWRSGMRLRDEQSGELRHFKEQKGMAYSQIFRPADAPAWVLDRQRLWNEVERAEMRINSQLARLVVVALPVELLESQQIELVSKWVGDQFLREKMIADVNIDTRKQSNPHAQIMLTTREVGLDGWAKKKNRDWGKKPLLLKWRESWAKSTNLALEAAGHDVRIDHRSHAERKLAVYPSVKEGNVGARILSERKKENKEIRKDNSEYLQQYPEDVIDLCKKEGRTYWSKEDMEGIIRRHSTDETNVRDIMAAVMGHDDLLCSKDSKGKPRYTARVTVSETEQVAQSHTGD